MRSSESFFGAKVMTDFQKVGNANLSFAQKASSTQDTTVMFELGIVGLQVGARE